MTKMSVTFSALTKTAKTLKIASHLYLIWTANEVVSMVTTFYSIKVVIVVTTFVKAGVWTQRAHNNNDRGATQQQIW